MASFRNLARAALSGLGVTLLSSLAVLGAEAIDIARQSTNALPGASIAAKPSLTNQASRIAVPVVPGFQLRSNDCVVFLGGANTVSEAKYAYLETLLARRYPGKRVRFRNMGWEGDTVFRQERPMNYGDLTTVLKEQGTTALFLNFGLIESLGGQEGLDDFVRAYERLLNLLTLITPRLVLLSPNRIESHGTLGVDAVQENERVRLYAAAIRDLAERRGLPFIDLFRVRPPDSAGFTQDGLHLSPYGHWRMAHEIERQLGLPPAEWEVEINTATRQHEARGTTLSKVVIANDSVRFQALDQTLPGPIFRADATNLSVWRGRMLKIAGLKPGRYVLKIDGQPLYEKGHLFWEKGWMLTHGPELEQIEELRNLIVEKNADFFNYWRPQNWAFLNGDLTGQPSSRRHDNPNVRWFPEEMKSFPALISRKEVEMEKLAVPHAHTYELTRKE